MHALTLLLPLLFATTLNADQSTVIVVVGAPGNEKYRERFTNWAGNWESAAQQAKANFVSIGLTEKTKADDVRNDRELLKQSLDGLADSQQPVWLIFIGHGTFDGQRAKFNFRGPDATAEELVEWIKPLSAPLAIVNCASASGPFINRLSGPNRVIVTATKSGYEQNYARFGEYISNAISDPQADLDKDGQTSLLEAWLKASANVRDFYKQESRLATEQSLIDDNGDALGTPAEWFQGFRAVRMAKDGARPDGNRANQFVLIPSGDDRQIPAAVKSQRDALELEIADLRARKSKLSADDYYQSLEPLLIKLARLYEMNEDPMRINE